MIHKIAVKSFWHNRKNFILFFINTVLAISMIFSFLYIQQLTSAIEKNELFFDQTLGYINIALLKIFPGIVLAVIFSMLYTIKFYLKTRMEDYSLLLILGIDRKTFYGFLAVEYMCGWLLSLVCALIVGNGIVKVLLMIMRHYNENVMSVQVSVGNVYKYTFLWSVAILCGVLLAAAMFLSEKNLSDLFQKKTLEERRPKSKWWLVPAAFGAALIVISFKLKYYLYNNWDSLLIVLCCLGVFLMFTCGGGLVLEMLKRIKKYYYRHILEWNQLYYRFATTKNMVFLLFVVNFIALYFVFGTINEYMPYQADEAKYPHDFVLSAEENNQFLEEFQKKYNCDTLSFPCVMMSLEGKEERIGISVSEYNRIWKEELTLKQGEVYVVVERKDFAYVEDEIEGQTRLLCPAMGKGDGEKKVEQAKHYRIAGEKERFFFGFNMAGLIVFEDKEFERLRTAGEAKEIVVMNLPKQYRQEADKEMQSYLNSNEKVKGYGKQNVIFSTELHNLCCIAIVLFLGLFIVSYSMFLAGVKIYAELPEMLERSEFLRIMGMRKKEIKRLLRKELRFLLVTPAALATVIGLLFLYDIIGGGNYAMLQGLSAWEIIKALLSDIQIRGLIMVFSGYLLLEVIYYQIVKYFVLRKVDYGNFENRKFSP